MQLIDGTESFPITPPPAGTPPMPTPGVLNPPSTDDTVPAGAQPVPVVMTPTMKIGSDDIGRVVNCLTFDEEDTANVTPEVTATAAFLQAVLGYAPRIEAESHGIFIHSQKSQGITTNMLLSGADLCFQGHLPLGLRPEVLWQTVLGQIAIEVKQNPETYRHLFTTSPNTETIQIRHDGLRMGNPWGWDQAIGMFREPLSERVPGDLVDLAMPDGISTCGDPENLACLVTFMDAASPYYEYVVRTRCGIPQVALFGTTDDWINLQDRITRLSRLFPSLSNYFAAIDPIVAKLVGALEGEGVQPGRMRWENEAVGGDPFWISVYKRNSGSGGDKISGWLTAFFAFLTSRKGQPVRRENFNWEHGSHGGFNPASFPSSVSVVDFKWDYFGTNHEMKFVGGVITTVKHGEFVTPRLGWSVVHANAT